jgi:hypothetical protein
MNRWARWLLYSSVLVGSFLAAYVLTAPEEQATNSSDFKDIKTLRAELRNRNVSNYSDLLAMARQSGLRASLDIKGFVEEVQRVGDDVEISGWLVDLAGDGEPPFLFIFAGGKLVAETRPKGERKDVTRALNLSEGIEENVKFSVKVKCRAGELSQVLAVSTFGFYSVMNSARCP